MTQTLAGSVSIILMSALAVIFLLVARSASQPTDDAAVVAARAARVRILGFWTLLATGVVVSAFTLRRLPYHESGAAMSEDHVVRITAVQWAWVVEGDSVPAGVPIRFDVESKDVNHGFGIYDDSLRMLVQVQVMPGYVNRLTHTFARPGTYHVLCLEYCGLAHHAMRATITVTGAAE